MKTEIIKNATNGYQYIGYRANQVTQSFPTTTRGYAGYFISLHGDAQATYPSCMEVITEDYTKYFGYVYSDHKPSETELETVKLSINGVSVPRADMSSSNPECWEFTGCNTSFNIRVRSKTDMTPETPAELRSGCFYKLHGENYIYESGDSFILSFRDGV